MKLTFHYRSKSTWNKLNTLSSPTPPPLIPWGAIENNTPAFPASKQRLKICISLCRYWNSIYLYSSVLLESRGCSLQYFLKWENNILNNCPREMVYEKNTKSTFSWLCSFKVTQSRIYYLKGSIQYNTMRTEWGKAIDFLFSFEHAVFLLKYIFQFLLGAAN